EPTVEVFADAASTAVVTCFEVGAPRTVVTVRRVARIDELADWDRGRRVPVPELARAPRWTPLTPPPRARPDGLVELRQPRRVHRGQVTGANDAWVVGDDDDEPDLPGRLLYPTVTRAKELFAAGPCLRDAAGLRRVIDLPEDLDELTVPARR